MNLPNGTYYVEIMGVVFISDENNEKYKDNYSFVYPYKQFTIGQG